MAITIQHGIPAGLTPKIPITARTAGGVGRGVGVGGARGAAGGRGGADPAQMMRYQAELQAFHGQQAREQAYELEVQKMHEQARVQASQFEYKFSAQQRQKIAGINNARQFIASSPDFSEEEKQQANYLLNLQQMGISPDAMPRDPNKPVYPEGQDIGQIWEQFGGIIGRAADGKPFIIFRPDQMPAAMEEKVRMEREKVEEARQVKWEEERRKKYMEWSMEDIPEIEPSVPGGFLGIGAKEAGPTGQVRKRTPEEVEVLLQRFFPRPQQPGGATQEEMEQELQRRADIAMPWWRIPERQGIEVTDADKQLPPDVGRARAYMRYFRDTYDSIDKIPAEIKPQAIGFAEILRSYKTQSGM